MTIKIKTKYNLDNSQLEKLFISGKTYGDLASIFGVPRSIIKGRLKKLRNTLSEEELSKRRQIGINKCIAKRAINLTNEEIQAVVNECGLLNVAAKKLNIPTHKFYKHCKKRGIIAPPKYDDKWSITDDKGYRHIYNPNKDRKNGKSTGVQQEHRYIIEKYIGRKLIKDECVHHINYNRGDNAISNLALLTRAEHIKLHKLIEKYGAYKIGIIDSPPESLKFDHPILYGGKWIKEIKFN